MTDYTSTLTADLLIGQKIDADADIEARHFGGSGAERVVIQQFATASGLIECGTVYDVAENIIERWYDYTDNDAQ